MKKLSAPEKMSSTPFQPDRTTSAEVTPFRKNELMTLVVKDLSDQDIADLASYYSAIEVSAQPPK
jgi:cytochrome c553